MHPGDPEATLDPHDQDLEAQMDFFHKLGYSTAQVQAVQQKFGPFTDTDKVLGELVRVGAGPEAKPGPVTMISVLVPRGGVQAAGATLQLPLAPENSEDEESLRPVVIDGSNVAMSHGNKEVFSCLGIQLSVSFFLDRGHTEVTVFVPSWRKEHPRPDAPITDQHILRDLERKKILVFTPSRRYAGKRVVCNDDVFIVKLAYETDGIIVSNDMYRDLQGDRPEWKRFIEERLLMYSFVNNKFMPPDDPLGRHGPTLENFLRKFPKTQKKQQCPYGKKCTYGVKCKFLHPERAKQSSRSVADELHKNAKRPQRRASCNSSPQPGQSLLMVEDMAQKLSLGQESSSVKKDPRPEHVKSSQCSSRRTTSRKEKPGQCLSLDHSSGRGGVCEEQLDSGLGSIDSQLREAPRNQIEHQYGASLLSCQTPCVQPHYCPPTSVPCSCCPHGPHCQGPTPTLQHRTQHQSLGLVSGLGSDVTPYAPPQYQDCGPYRLSVPAYSEPVSRVHTCQHQMFWSDPYRGHPLAVYSRRGECSQWELDGGGEERQVVRKKLLAIFSAHLVDMAMDLFPHIMDPQLLVAEILMLQGQNRVQR